jgi:hypothetical protein
MTPEDWLTMQGDLLAVRDMNATSIVLRRGAETLAAQTVRVARMGFTARKASSAGAQEATTGVVVMGVVTLDIQAGDRFTLSGGLYEVTFIRPNRRAATVAEAQAVE